jgi:hypothetical protein
LESFGINLLNSSQKSPDRLYFSSYHVYIFLRTQQLISLIALIREHLQLSNVDRVDILFTSMIKWDLSKSEMIRTFKLSFPSYDRFIGILAYSKLFSKISNEAVSTWNCAHNYIAQSLGYPKSCSWNRCLFLEKLNIQATSFFWPFQWNMIVFWTFNISRWKHLFQLKLLGYFKDCEI